MHYIKQGFIAFYDGTASISTQIYALLITTVFGFLTTLANQLYQAWNQSRERRWDKEDRIAAQTAQREDAERKAQAIKDELERSRIEAALASQKHSDEVIKQIKINSEGNKGE